MRNEETLRDIWDNIKHNNIHIREVPEELESEQDIENLSTEIMAENIPNHVKK